MRTHILMYTRTLTDRQTDIDIIIHCVSLYMFTLIYKHYLSFFLQLPIKSMYTRSSIHQLVVLCVNTGRIFSPDGATVRPWRTGREQGMKYRFSQPLWHLWQKMRNLIEVILHELWTNGSAGKRRVPIVKKYIWRQLDYHYDSWPISSSDHRSPSPQ